MNESEIKLPSKCCAICSFYMLSISRCRRNPPQIIVTGKSKASGIEYQSVFPPMATDGWCGEFVNLMTN